MAEETVNPNLQTKPLKAEYGHLREQRSVTAAPAPVEPQREQPFSFLGSAGTEPTLALKRW